MSYLQVPHPWNPGYAIPDYVQAEPPGRCTYTTAWLPRGTIDGLVPDYLAKPMRDARSAMGFSVGGVTVPSWALLAGAAVGAGLLIRRMRRRRR